jgi:hypothetical protein
MAPPPPPRMDLNSIMYRNLFINFAILFGALIFSQRDAIRAVRSTSLNTVPLHMMLWTWGGGVDIFKHAVICSFTISDVVCTFLCS